MERTQTAIRSKWQTVGLIAIAAALVATLLPAGFAEGSSDSDPVAVGPSSVVLLNLGDVNDVTWNGQPQEISTHRVKCTPTVPGTTPEWLAITPGGGDLGLKNGAMGVRGAREGNGEPCIRVNAGDEESLNESITVALGSDLADYLMTAIDVDLELKFNASVEVDYYRNGQTDPVASDVFENQGGSDNDPDSGNNDNFRYAYQPMDGASQIYFDTVVFTASAGAFSLEAGYDGTKNGKLDPTNSSSQFQIVRVFDGELECSPDSATIGDPSATSGTVIMRAIDLKDSGAWITAECPKKPYNSETDTAALSFVPAPPQGSPLAQARYTMVVTVQNQPITTDSTGQITSLVAEYDLAGSITFPAGSGTPLQACLRQPVLVNDSGDTVYVDFWKQQPNVGLLPADESACFYSVSVTPTRTNGDGDVVGTEVWGIYFEDDPGFSFR